MASLFCASASVSVSVEPLNWAPASFDSSVYTPVHLKNNDGEDGEGLGQMCLDAAILGDFPARYTIPCVPEHAFPVMGVYVDKRILPGFKYRINVLPYPDCEMSPFPLFGGSALLLLSIGRGYSRRLMFEPIPGLADDETVLWADSHPGGLFLELSVIAPGDRFCRLSQQGLLLGYTEIIQVEGPQEEIEVINDGNIIQKNVKAVFKSCTRWIDYRKGISTETVQGIIECVKSNQRAAQIKEITLEDGSKMLPLQHRYQPTLCVGDESGIPTMYTIQGLLDTEFPVIGTYVDPRILPGLSYRVRRLPSCSLFGGKPVKLTSIGIGYGKRISFHSPIGSTDDLTFWSDSSPGGFAFEPVAVEDGTFLSLNNHSVVLKLEVVRVASRARHLETILTGTAIDIVFSVDLICRVRSQSLTPQKVGHFHRFTGSALFRKSNSRSDAILISIGNLEWLTPRDSSIVQDINQAKLIPR